TVAWLPHHISLIPPGHKEAFELVTSPHALHTALDNLARNSVEAMPGGGEIHVDWTAEEDELLIEVFDTGPGLSAAFCERFARGDLIDSTKRTGSGVGLVAARSLLSAVGGVIVAEHSASGARW